MENGRLEMALTLGSARRACPQPTSGDLWIGHEQRPLKAIRGGETAERRLLILERSSMQPFERILQLFSTRLLPKSRRG